MCGNLILIILMPKIALQLVLVLIIVFVLIYLENKENYQ